MGGAHVLGGGERFGQGAWLRSVLSVEGKGLLSSVIYFWRVSSHRVPACPQLWGFMVRMMMCSFLMPASIPTSPSSPGLISCPTPASTGISPGSGLVLQI